jgi:hypothetical protein
MMLTMHLLGYVTFIVGAISITHSFADGLLAGLMLGNGAMFISNAALESHRVNRHD